MHGEAIAVKLDGEGDRVRVAVIGDGSGGVGKVRLFTTLPLLLLLSHTSPEPHGVLTIEHYASVGGVMGGVRLMRLA